MPPKKTQALVFHRLLCTVIQLFLVICHTFAIHIFKILVHVDIQIPPPPGWTSVDFLLTPPPPLLVHAVVECHLRYIF